MCRGDMIELERVFRACESCHTSRIQCTQRQTEEQVYRGTCTCTYPIVRFTPNAAHGLIAEQYNTIKFYNTIHYTTLHIHTYPHISIQPNTTQGDSTSNIPLVERRIFPPASYLQRMTRPGQEIRLDRRSQCPLSHAATRHRTGQYAARSGA